MLEYFIVTLLPAAVVLGIILLIRMRRAIRNFRRTANKNALNWHGTNTGSHPNDALWRRAYRG